MVRASGGVFALGNTAQFPPDGLSTAPADLRAKSRRKASVALRSASLRLGVRHAICVAKMLENIQSIFCAFCLAAGMFRSSYRYSGLCVTVLVSYSAAYVFASSAASSAWVPALSQMMVGVSPRSFSSASSGAWGGPYSVSAKVRWHFSPPLV